MKIVTRQEGPTTIVEPKGAFAGAACDDFALAMKRTLETEQFQVVVDLRSVSVLDSRALEALLKYKEKLVSLGGRFTITNPSAKVSTILRVTRLERDLEV